MNDYIISAIRTGVPILVGWVIFMLNNWLEPLGVEVDSEAVAGPVLGAIIWAYYLLARWLETRFPQVKWLGISSTPSYDQ